MQTVFEPFSNSIFTVLILFKYCFITVGESGTCITVSKTVSLLSGNFENTVLLQLENFVIFGLLFCILFRYCFVAVGIGSKITVFFACVSSN